MSYPTTGVTSLGSGSPSSGDAAPVASAGANQQQAGLGLVTLDGSGSSAGVSYSWSMVKITTAGSADATGLLSATNVAGPTFTPAAAGDTYVATLTVTRGGLTDTDVVVIYVDPAAAGDAWVNIDLTAPDWTSDPNTTLDTVDASALVTTTATSTAAARTALLLGYTIQASYTWLTAAKGVILEVAADQPDGSGVVMLGAAIVSGTNQTTAIGQALGIEWNSARTACRATAGVIGAANADGGSCGTPSRVTASIYIPFTSDRPDVNSTVNIDNAGTLSDSAIAAAMGSAFSDLHLAIIVENGGAAVSWGTPTARYKLVSA